MSNDIMLSVAQVLALAPGDDKNASWIDPGLTGLITRIETKRSTKPNGRDFWPCTVRDLRQDVEIETTFFGSPPPFKEGDVVEFSGKGLRRTENRGFQQFLTTKDTVMRVIHVDRPASRPAPPAAGHRGDPPAPGYGRDDRGSAPPPEDGAQPTGEIFHHGMRKNAQLWIHCWKYAIKIQEQLQIVMLPEQQQALVSTLFIEGCKQGLRSCVPPVAGAPKTTPPHGGRDDRPAQRREDNTGDNIDEDVPF